MSCNLWNKLETKGNTPNNFQPRYKNKYLKYKQKYLQLKEQLEL